ncbi:MAG: phasin family protein [Alphaproteobacteria bacterium]|nr:phasin family protein [Alphaproteobacteria bacterium]
MAKAKKTSARTKAQPKTSGAFEALGLKQAAPIVTRVQDGLREAGDAFRQAGGTMGHESRKVALTIVSHVQDNVIRSFEALRETIEAETFAEAVKIQQHAMTDMFRRGIQQFREVSEIVGQSGNKSLKPITKLVSTLRDARKAA